MGWAAALALLAAAPAARAEPRPVRIMSLNQCTDQLVLMLVPRSRIRSVSWLARDPAGSALAGIARHVPTNRGAAEEILRDRPDLVIAGSYTTPATRGLLRRLGMPLLEVPPADDFPAIRATVRQVAAAVGERARGEAMIARMDADLASLAAARGPRPRVAAWDGAGLSARSGSLYAAILAAAGARNVADTAGSGDLGIERLLALAPQLLVRGLRALDTPGRDGDLAYHPLVRRYWHDREVSVPQWATSCGTPLSARAAVRLRADMLRRLARATPYAGPRR